MLHPPLAVVDTNILVSALLRPASVPGAVASAIRQLRLVPAVCDEIVAEYEAVLNRAAFPFPPRDVADLVGLIAQQAQWIWITPYPAALALPDPADWPFIAIALAADCPVITGNARHFPKRTGVQVMTARQWLDNRL